MGKRLPNTGSSGRAGLRSPESTQLAILILKSRESCPAAHPPLSQSVGQFLAKHIFDFSNALIVNKESCRE
jgi:hypothetical protein